MSKKIIALIAVVTVVFVGLFAACTKNDEDEGVYIKNDDIDLVTDENGEKVLAEGGELLVYATDENGDRVKKENGEYETLVQQFQPFEDDGVMEDYGFKFTIPEDWKSTNDFAYFEKNDSTQNIEIDVVEYTYRDYYKQNKDFCEKLQKESPDTKITWEENVDLGKDFKGVCRFTMEVEEGTSVLYLFENSGNVYKVLFNTKDSATAIEDSEAMCKSLTFKPYTYYPDVTSKSENSNS